MTALLALYLVKQLLPGEPEHVIGLTASIALVSGLVILSVKRPVNRILELCET